jgi:colanic acid biosynthesis glycosyl transferase WcaI
LTTETVVQYSGNQGVSHTFEEIIEVALRLRDVPGLRFVFVGDGSRHHELEEAKARLSLQNVLLVPFQPVSLLAQSLSLGDIHFVSLRPGFEGLVVPSKAYGVLAAGRPMIYLGRSQGEIARMVSETGMGQVISPGDVDGLERAVLEAHRNVEARERQGRTALEVFRARYGRAHSVGRYVDLLVGSTAKRSA